MRLNAAAEAIDFYDVVVRINRNSDDRLLIQFKRTILALDGFPRGTFH
ncbi:MAG: hypothetical protein M3Y76_12160 [Chloroflexota bacterium]|nr:hypothetical protein [Chloroflexota bacterium]